MKQRMIRSFVKVVLFAVAVFVAATAAHAAGPLGIAVEEKQVYVYWGPLDDGPEGHELQRAKGDGKFKTITKILPVTDMEKANRILKNAPDALSRALTLDAGFEKRAEENPGVDEGMALASVGYAVVRGYGYLDNDVSRRTHYRYRLVRVASGDTVSVIAEGEADTGRPTQPAAVTAGVELEGEKPSLTWNSVAYVRYHVQRAESPEVPYTRLTLMPLPSLKADQPMRYDDANAVSDGRRYYYQVVAYSLLDQPGAIGPPVAITTSDRTPPAPPAELDVENRPAAVMLSWKGSTESDLAGYHLYRREVNRTDEGAVGASAWARITGELLAPKTVTFEDRSPNPGRIYQYKISALDLSGNESRHSLPVLGLPRDVMPPARPEGLGVRVNDNGRVTLTWKANSDADLYAYRIYRAADEGELSFVLELPVKYLPSGPSVSHAEQLDTRSEATYRYAVSAVDATESESAMSIEASVRLPDLTPPMPPILAGLRAESGAIELTWAPSPSGDVAGYHVYRGEAKDKLMRVSAKPLPPDALNYHDGAARPGVIYYYAVSAVDQSGNEGALSEVQSSVTFLATDPVAPSALTLDKTVKPWRLAWQAPQKARGFIVYIAGARDGDYRQFGAVVIKRLIEVPAPEDETHWYRVQAVYENGVVSALSEPVAVERPREKTR